MWNKNIRAHGDYFAKAQTVSGADVAGNQANNNPMRLLNSQGGTAVRMAVAREDTLSVANGASVTLTVTAAKSKAGAAVILGTAVYVNDTGATEILRADATLADFILPPKVEEYNWVSVSIKASTAPTGTVDIFPHYISHCGR